MSLFYSYAERPLQTHFPPLSAQSFSRTSGPPANLGFVGVWTFIAVAAFCSLLWLPQLALRSGRTKEQRALQAIQDQIAGAANDIRAAAFHFWGCVAVILGYDVVLRILSLILLSPRQLFIQQYVPLVTVNQTFYCDSLDAFNAVRVPLGTGRIPLCDEVPDFWWNSAATAAANSGGGRISYASSTQPTMGINDVAAPFNAATAQGTTLILSQLSVSIIAALVVLAFLTVRQWKNHTRKYFLSQLPEQQPLPVSHNFVARREPMMVTTFYMMALWLLVMLTAFGYKRAMPLVMRIVYPSLICFAGAFSLMVQ